jgi:hypothetical protein
LRRFYVTVAIFETAVKPLEIQWPDWRLQRVASPAVDRILKFAKPGVSRNTELLYSS